MLHWGTQGYMGVHRARFGYAVLDKATQGFMGLHRDAYSYTGLHYRTLGNACRELCKKSPSCLYIYL